MRSTFRFRVGPEASGAGGAELPTGVGGAGGAGQAPSFSSKVLSTTFGSTKRIPKLKTSSFCDQYHLGPEIRALLEKHEFATINSFLRQDETTLKALDFKVGHIAELRWAAKKMLVDNGIPTTNIPQGEYMRTDIRGGTGGAGGYSPGIGGPGGIGEAPHLPSMRIEDLFRRFSDIRGGIGGTGGTGGLVPPTFVVGNGEANLDDVDGGALKRPNLIGGQGGTGGFGTNKGGMGGVGEATELSVTDVALFRRISGGVGGTGGASEFEGGGGGVGKASTVTSPLVDFLDDKTRRRLPYKKLDDLDFDSPALGQLLKNLGFESAGGLLELHEPDIPSQSKLKAGQRGELMDVLEDFIWLDED